MVHTDVKVRPFYQELLKDFSRTIQQYSELISHKSHVKFALVTGTDIKYRTLKQGLHVLTPLGISHNNEFFETSVSIALFSSIQGLVNKIQGLLVSNSRTFQEKIFKDFSRPVHAMNSPIT